MRVVIPFKKKGAKSRLSPVLSKFERGVLAVCMLHDVIDALKGSCVSDIDILTTSENIHIDGVNVIHDDSGGLNESLNNYIAQNMQTPDAEPILIIMADLPLIRAQHINDIVKHSQNAGIVIAPGTGGGTNILAISDPAYRVNYYGASFLDHINIAQSLGIKAMTYDSLACATDIDEPSDLVELLLRGNGNTAECIQSFGFALEIASGRVRIKR
ncbi:MAG: 2-phospho-L-lactate guanylyltransferase [Methanosarcinales archaeon]|nr:2-phospho-L-lactate guanylyltransferase [Methanosarcinales archaeon]